MTPRTVADWQEAALRAIKTADPEVTITRNHESTQWLRGRIWSGPVSWCPHVVYPLNPATTPAVLALKGGGYLSCDRCALGGQVPPGPVAEQSCDRCGESCSEINFAELLFGLVVVVFGLCPACADREFPQ